jgi:GTP cyclohydrolase I
VEIDREKIERSVRLLLAGIGENPKREGLFGTPGRIAAFFEEFLGLRDTFESVRKLFQVESDGRYVLLAFPSIRSVNITSCPFTARHRWPMKCPRSAF